MSIATEITRLQTAKADIKTAIEAKGVTVPSSATVDTYDDYVSQISSGGGSTADTAALKGVIDRSLTEIDIPSGITSIGDYAFYHCYDLTAVTIPNSVTSISDWSFCYCSGLTSVIIPDSVTSINDNAFNNCRNLASITIGSGVTTIGKSVFLNNYNLTSVSIPDNVTSLDQQAFSYCSGLTSVTIGSGVTSIGQSAFNGCRSLTNIAIPDSVTSIGNSAFYNCTSLSSCTIGSGVTSIGSSVFYGCNYLMGVTIEATTPPTLGNNALSGYFPIYVPCDSVNTYKAASGWSSYASRIQAIPNSCVTPKWIATYTGGTTSSAECDASSAITRGDIEVTDLESVEIKDCVTSIDNAIFRSCNSLTSCTIGSGVTSMGYRLFYYCTGLTSVTVNAITPPSLNWDQESQSFDYTNNCPIYVPSESVEAYKAALGWSMYASRIQAIPT